MAADKSTSRRYPSIQFNLFPNAQKNSTSSLHYASYPHCYRAKKNVFLNKRQHFDKKLL